jgi:hypothetical protein
MTITTLKLKGHLGSVAAAKVELGSTENGEALIEKSGRVIINLQDLVYTWTPDIRMLLPATQQFQKRSGEFATVRPYDNTANKRLITIGVGSHRNMVEAAEVTDGQAPPSLQPVLHSCRIPTETEVQKR